MNKAKARIICYGIDDELKNSTDSIYSTVIKSTLYPVPAAIAPSAAPSIEGVRTGVEAVNFTQRLNTKRFRFSLNPNIKNLKLSQNARLVIESITIPNVINDLHLQSKCVNNVVLRLKGISNHNLWDSSSQGKGSSIIFTCPILLNTQGFGRTFDNTATANPDFNIASQKARINCDNNGYLFTNTNPNMFYNFSINEDFLKNGILEFELIYDIGNITKLTNIIGVTVGNVILGSGGNNYTEPTTVSFTGGGGTGATATADIGFPVQEVIMSNTGSGYTSDPTITFSAPTIAGGTTATGTAVRGFPISSLNFTNVGSGFNANPIVTIAPPPPVSLATAVATVSGGVVTSITLTNNGGLGYISTGTPPVIAITPTNGGTGATATAIINATTTRITGFNVTNGGTGYIGIPTITVIGGGGVQATATCGFNPSAPNQAGPLTITNAGSGYLSSSPPSVTVSPSNGFGGGVIATSSVNPASAGNIKNITITSGGVGYLSSSPPTITITGGAGTNASGTAVLNTSAGVVRRINLLTGGSGYINNPNVVFSGGAGTGATATTTLGGAVEAHYIQTPQTLDINTDKNDLESFMISMVITDEEEEDKIYNNKKLLNKINRLLLDNTDK